MQNKIIYLVRKRGLGDVLWTEPVIRDLSANYKKVVVYTKFTELFANAPFQNVVFRKKLTIFEKVIWKIESFFNISVFFITLDGAYEKKPKMHFLNAYQLQAGIPITQEYPRIYFSKTELSCPPLITEKYAILHLESFATKNYRQVFGVDWEKVVQFITEKGFKVVQIGKAATGIKNTQYVTTSIREMIMLINSSSFFIGIDSGPSHIAASLGVPSLIFFGAVNPDFRHFRSIFKGFILQQACEYAGCYHESVYKKEVDCRLVENKGIPKCSFHTDEYVIKNVDLLIKKYVAHAPQNNSKSQTKTENP